MLSLFRNLLCFLGAVVSASAAYAYVETPDSKGNTVGAMVLYWLNAGVATPASSAMPVPAFDANNAAFQGVVAITPGTATTPLRSIGYIITVAGNVTLTLADGSMITLALAASPQIQTLPFAVANIALGVGTVGIFWNLK